MHGTKWGHVSLCSQHLDTESKLKGGLFFILRKKNLLRFMSFVWKQPHKKYNKTSPYSRNGLRPSWGRVLSWYTSTKIG